MSFFDKIHFLRKPIVSKNPPPSSFIPDALPEIWIEQQKMPGYI